MGALVNNGHNDNTMGGGLHRFEHNRVMAMIKLLANVLLRTLLVSAFALWALGITATVRAQASCPPGSVLYETVVEYMLATHGEVPMLAAVINRPTGFAMTIFVNPKSRTWTTFIVRTDRCTKEMKLMNGTGWPFAE